MPESLGARLRRRREEQQIGLASIAERTKISLSLLEALERDDVSHWPGGIFRRAFVRTYAQTIGLDPDAIVREFLELYPDPKEEAAISAIAANGGDAAATPPTGLRARVGSLFGSLLPRRPDAIPPPAAIVQRPKRTLHEPSLPELRVPEPAMPELALPGPLDASAAARGVLGSETAVLEAIVPERPAAETAPPEIAPSETPAPLPVGPAPSAEPDVAAAARVCTGFGRLRDVMTAAPLLKEAARILDAVGLIVWVWDPQSSELRSALAHGYSDRVLAQLPRVRAEADNATAAAFRSGEPGIVKGGDAINGALVVPLMTAVGCVGVLALETRGGGEQRADVRALATIFSAQLALLIGTMLPEAPDATATPATEPQLSPLTARA